MKVMSFIYLIISRTLILNSDWLFGELSGQNFLVGDNFSHLPQHLFV